MKNNENPEENSTFAQTQPSDDWQIRKQEVLSKILTEKRNPAIIREAIVKEKEALHKSIIEIEERNHLKAKDIKDLQFEITQIKRNQLQIVKARDEQHKKMLQLQIKEKSLLNEIEFFEQELNDCKKQYQNLTQGLDQNLSALERSVKDMGFMRGETSALIDKMSTLENTVGEKKSDVNVLDETISTMIKELKTIHAKMLQVEKTAKVDYYHNKRQLEG